MIEDLLTTLLVECDVSELIADDKVIGQEAASQMSKGLGCLRFAYLCKKLWHRSEVYSEAFQACLDAQSDGRMRFPRPRIAVHHHVTPFPDEVESLRQSAGRSSLTSSLRYFI